MKYIILVCFVSLFIGCQDKQSKNKVTPEKIVSKEIDNNKANKITKTNASINKLNSKNAMEFFLQYDKYHKENKVRITTDFGAIDILLFDETKFHRSNFIFLTKKKYFNGTQFYRVINNFMIQAGNSDDQQTMDKRNTIGRYLLPPDTKRGFKHDRGVISMPSSEIDNPHKLASPYEFFIVQQKGGAHYLDGDYTIFGKVIKGMDVVDKIAAVDTDDGDWPRKNVFIKHVEIIP